MPPTTATVNGRHTVTLDPYAVPDRTPHPAPTDSCVHARARAHQIAALRRQVTRLRDEHAATVLQLETNRITEMQAITDHLLVEVRNITASVRVVEVGTGGAVFEGPNIDTARCALLGTRNALARALRKLDEADTAGLDAITAITADVDDRLDRITRQIAAIDYGTKVGAA